MANVESLLEEGAQQHRRGRGHDRPRGRHRGRFDRGEPAPGVAPPGGRASRTVRYVNLPANLQSLAELYGVTELLGEA